MIEHFILLPTKSLSLVSPSSDVWSENRSNVPFSSSQKGTGFDMSAYTILGLGDLFIFQLSTDLSSHLCHCILLPKRYCSWPSSPTCFLLQVISPQTTCNSAVSCADNSLISFHPINVTSLSSNQSSAHSSARSLLMSSYQFTLHTSQHNPLFLPLQIFPFISFSHSTITVLLILTHNFSPS